MTVQERVSTNVRVLCAVRRRDIPEVARAIGIARATIYQKLKGQRGWHLEDVEALASYFGVPISALLEDPRARFPTVSELPRHDSNVQPALYTHGQLRSVTRTPSRMPPLAVAQSAA